MWSYYGAKTNIVDLYPPPKYGKIIEPFAGTARYALKYWEREVLLVDKYPVITDIWKWLQLCSPDDIRKLPLVKAFQSLDDFNFDCAEAKLLMGFLVGYGLEQPRVTATNKQNVRPNFINFSLQRIAKNLHKIKHWEIRNGSYSDIENEEATWFIDPPYQFGGACYPMSSKKINFQALGIWSMDRKGHIIVCESTKADWMDFKPMAKHKGRTGIQKEAIWSNYPTPYDNEQQLLF